MKKILKICTVISLTGIIYFYVKTMYRTDNPGKDISFSGSAVHNRLQETLLVENQYEKKCTDHSLTMMEQKKVL